MTAPTASPDPTPAEDFARPALEAQMAGLARLADIALEMAEGLGRIVAREANAAEPDPAFDLAAVSLAHHRADRAVRMSYALQQVVIDRLRVAARIEADQAQAAARAEAAEAQARLEAAEAKAMAPAHARKVQIAEAVTRIMADAHEDDPDDKAFKRHIRQGNERLRDPDVFADVLSRPASEIIAGLCRDLGLEPNWEGLAFEAWALEEQESENLGAPLRSPPPWTGKRPGVRGRLLKAATEPAEPPPLPDDPPLPAPSEQSQACEPEPPQIVEAPPNQPPPYVPPPDPDILPGYPVGLPGEYPPERPKRRPYWT